LCRIDQFAHQVFVPKEPIIRPLPQRLFPNTLSGLFLIPLPLEGICQIDTMGEPQSSAFQT
jgi:hypothetical protein